MGAVNANNGTPCEEGNILSSSELETISIAPRGPVRGNQMFPGGLRG